MLVKQGGDMKVQAGVGGVTDFQVVRSMVYIVKDKCVQIVAVL